MPSNSMYVCLDCRVGGKGRLPLCVRDSHRTLCFGSRISVPKKNNRRAWKRIENGDYLWNKRRVHRDRGKDEYPTWDYEKVPVEPDPSCDCSCCNTTRRSYRVVVIPGSKKMKINYNRLPDVDMGG